MTFSAKHAGTWLLLLILGSIPLRFILGMMIPPWREVGRSGSRYPFVLWYASVAVTLPLGIIGLGWFQVFTGSSKSELAELMVDVSLPLAWIRSDFLLDGSKSFLDACGVVVGNSFFYTLWMFVAWRGVRALLRRNRTTAINIEGHQSEGDDE